MSLHFLNFSFLYPSSQEETYNPLHNNLPSIQILIKAQSGVTQPFLLRHGDDRCRCRVVDAFCNKKAY